MPAEPTPNRLRRRRASAALERTALEIESVLESRHLPHGGVLDPIFAAPDSDNIARYTRAGDSAIWTGHYLASQAFRVRAGGGAPALAALRKALWAIGNLVHVTGGGLLARAALPADSPWAQGIAQEEAANGVYETQMDGRPWVWIGNTSRDQYLGVFFGLSAVFELIVDDDVRSTVRDLVTRMLDRLLDAGWAVVMPGGEVSTVFWQRVDQRLALLQVGRQVNDERFSGPYRRERLAGSLGVMAPLAFETLDPHGSYFKFNLESAAMYCLARQELSDTHRERYLDAHRLVRKTLDDHGNAHFNMIDRVLQGPDARRDRETVRLLEEWLLRPRRDFGIDFRGRVEMCGDNRTCKPLPVRDRVRTDFLWQRSPFQASGGGDGFIETAGIDFTLPYWMARVYGVL